MEQEMQTQDELLVDYMLRKKIRKKINEAINKKKKTKDYLRKYIRNIIIEAIDDTSPAHESTGINVLEDVIDQIIPTLKSAYKGLTSNEDQRESFRAHIINAADNILRNASQETEVSTDGKLDDPGIENGSEIPSSEPSGLEGLSESNDWMSNTALGDVNEDIPDQSKFIDINRNKKPKKKDVQPSAEEDFGIDGYDKTGRNMALPTFKKIEKQIVSGFKMLDDPSDRELYHDWLITNLKLYFDQFEQEMAPKIDEPTTPEYDAETQQSGISDEEQIAEQVVGILLKQISDLI